MSDFKDTFHCSHCDEPVHIRVDEPMNPFFVIAFWAFDLRGLCSRCLKQLKDNKP